MPPEYRAQRIWFGSDATFEEGLRRSRPSYED
jgi:hypothetical protein